MANEPLGRASLIRLAISVEGETEEAFVKHVLAEHLRANGVEPVPILPRHKGGNISVDRLAPAMADLCWNFDFVTSLVDFYGFRGKGDLTPQALEAYIDREVIKHINRSFDESRVFSYVQRHEFEGLLFSDVKVFSMLYHAPNDAVSVLQNVRSHFPTPEDINDNTETAPSKRIKGVIPRYDKRNDGPDLAMAMGLSVIRMHCQRFDAWLDRLESLSR